LHYGFQDLDKKIDFSGIGFGLRFFQSLLDLWFFKDFLVFGFFRMFRCTGLSGVWICFSQDLGSFGFSGIWVVVAC